MQTQTEGSTTTTRRGRGTRPASGTTRSRAADAPAPPEEKPGGESTPEGATSQGAAASPPATDREGAGDVGSSPAIQLPFKQRALTASRQRFAGHPEREPITEAQLTYLLDLLHENGQNRSLVSSTYDYLERGMSKSHASAQIDKLTGQFGQPRKAA